MDIGGYGQLDISIKNAGIHKGAMALQSARACLYFYLEKVDVKVLYLPLYICNSLLPAINSLGIKVKWYSIDEGLLPSEVPHLEKGEFFLIVNYFGLLTKQIEKLLTCKTANIIIDNSQALFAKPFNCAATIYSPRKFLAIPDGGFLYSDVKVDKYLENYDSSNHVSHLLLRAAGNVQEGYVRFILAEKALDDFLPKKISIISNCLLLSADIDRIKKERKNHFAQLSDAFEDVNQLVFELNGEEVPLCYPLKLNFNVSMICKNLIRSDIFLPRYWPEIHLRRNAHWEKEIYEKTLFVPIDERINNKQMQFLIEKINLEISRAAIKK
ncbi:MAG: hypothetical protein HRT38_06240 [Alteromonadaceae bacterium]|nr:hypothetical protein [Alteromonadaceae bacterium]